MRFATWNTQGNFNETRKSAIIREINTGTNVLFVQEGGVEQNWSGGLYNSTGGQSVGAKNERCTNYVLVNSSMFNESASEVYYTTVGGGIAGRKPAAVRIGKTLLVSWHSISASDNTDTRQLLSESMELLSSSTVDAIVIGGDFNTSPKNIEDMITAMAAGRHGGRHYAVVIAPPLDMATHQSNKVLDFFVVMSSSSAAPRGQAWVCCVEPSDHEVVFMDLD